MAHNSSLCIPLSFLNKPLALPSPPTTSIGACLIQPALRKELSKMVGNLVVGYLYSGGKEVV